MRPAFLALAGAAALSTAFAAVETLAFATMLAVPVVGASIGDARAAGTAASVLYRWKEPDGSLTFSPTAPTDGTPYETVDPMTMRPLGEAVPRASLVRAVPAADEAATPAFTDPLPGGGAGEGLPAAPALGAAARPSPAAVVRGRAGELAPGTGVTNTAPPTNRSRTVAATDKERRCEELEKRVVSLERRLATPLTPDAMDATVVQMARYQRNADRHCR